MGANSGLMRGIRPMAKRASQQAKQARVAGLAARTLVSSAASNAGAVAQPTAQRKAATPAANGKHTCQSST